MKRSLCVALAATMFVAVSLTAQSPKGWMVRADRSTSASDPDGAGAIKFVTMGTGFHATNPQAAVYWNPTNTETGSYTTGSGTYSLNEMDTSSSTTTTTGNDISGTETVALTPSSGTTTLVETGSTSAGNFTVTETVYSGVSDTETLNIFSGSYSTTGSDSKTTTVTESNTSTNGLDSYTEITTDSATLTESGNTITGAFSRTRTGTTTTTLSGNIKYGSLIPGGNVSITLAGVTEMAPIDGKVPLGSSTSQSMRMLCLPPAPSERLTLPLTI